MCKGLLSELILNGKIAKMLCKEVKSKSQTYRVNSLAMKRLRKGSTGLKENTKISKIYLTKTSSFSDVSVFLSVRLAKSAKYDGQMAFLFFVDICQTCRQVLRLSSFSILEGWQSG